MIDFTRLQEEVNKTYQRYKLKSYKLYDKTPKSKDELEPLFSEIKNYIIKIKQWFVTKVKNGYHKIPKNRNQLIGVKDGIKLSIINRYKQHEKPAPPEAQGDLDVKFKNRWTEEVNINNEDKLEFMATHRKVVDIKDTVYIISLECLNNRDQDRDEDKSDDENENDEQDEELYDLYLDIEVLHTETDDDDEYYDAKQGGQRLANPNYTLTVTKNARIEKQAKGIDELESKINELISKYDHTTIKMMILELQDEGEVYVN